MLHKPTTRSVAIPLEIVHSQHSHSDGVSGEIVGTAILQSRYLPTDEQSHLINDLDTQQPIQPQRSIPRTSLIRTDLWEIVLAGALFLLPVALSAVLMYLIYTNLKPSHDLSTSMDSITEKNQTRSLSNQEYYVDYSATRLVFISSLSSTLALALVPVGMALFAYMTGRSMQKASASGDLSKLPSPYQFELTLRLLGGGFTDLYRYLQYLVRGNRRRVPTVYMVHYTALMLTALLLLAVLITIVDAFLHVATATVQYNRNTNLIDSSLNPGRRLPEICWDYRYEGATTACNIVPGGSGAKTQFDNSTEAY